MKTKIFDNLSCYLQPIFMVKPDLQEKLIMVQQ